MAFTFGRMYERLNPSVPKVAAYLNIGGHDSLSLTFIEAVFVELIARADKEIANASADVHTSGTATEPQS